jgi:hypothetical protein
VVGSIVAATGRPVGAAIGRMVGLNTGASVVGRDTGVGVTSVGVACGTESTGRYFMKRKSSMRNVYIFDETFDLLYKTKLNVPSAQTVTRKNNACVKVIPHFINMGVAWVRFMILRLNDAPSIVERSSIDVMVLYMRS